MSNLLEQMLAVPGFDYMLGAASFSVGGVFGFFVSRFTRSKAESDVNKQRFHENAGTLVRAKDEKFANFTAALVKALAKKKSAARIDLNDFVELSSAGNLYFAELRNVADACLSDRVTAIARTQTFVPALREAVETSLPRYYDALAILADGLGNPYTGELKRENYESIYIAVEKFDHLLPPSHHGQRPQLIQ